LLATFAHDPRPAVKAVDVEVVEAGAQGSPIRSAFIA
jgi:hypothetical protein